jgi:hypothetical protein
VQYFKPRLIYGLVATFWLVAGVARSQDDVSPPPPIEALISITDQKLVVLRDGGVIAKYRISTSRFGAGDSYGSYKTPLGKLRVCDKIGGDLSPGAVIRHRSATGEVIQVNAPGRDPIVTRVIWLEGLEEQNRNARARGIYIHGTPEESNLGKPVSWGCIRMRSEDVINVFEELPVGTPVTILADRLPRLHKYKPPPPPPPPPPPVIIAASTPTPAPVAKKAPALAAKQAPALAAKQAPVLAAKQAPAPVTKQTVAEVAKQTLAAAKVAAVATAAKNVKVASVKPTPAPSPVQFATAKAPNKKPAVAWVAEAKFARKSEDSNPSGEQGNSDAMRAMKGSILLAGMPGAPSPSGPKTPPASGTVAGIASGANANSKTP